MIALRGFRHPPTYHQERLRKAPTSHFYDVMTNGFGAMPSYAEVLTPEDRWKIIAYIRALQESQNATYGELNADDRQKLEAAEKAGEKSGTGAPTPTPTSGGHGN
jgi:mono/diheme cytochrome c family protein